MLKKLTYFIFILICSSCNSKKPSELYNQAFEFEEKGDFKKAIELLDKALEIEPDYRPALLNRGYYKTAIGNYKDGISDYKKILKFDPDNTLALYNIGINFQELENHNQAIAYFSKALNTKGALKSFENKNGGTFSLRTKLDWETEDGEWDYEIADCEIYFSRGVNYFFAQDYKAAIPDLEKSIASNCNKSDSYFLLGDVYLQMKDTITSCMNFKKSAEMGDIDAKEEIIKYCKN